MRRLTGTSNGTEYVLLEYAGGLVECASDVRELLCDVDGTMPTGTRLDAVCTVLFGDTFQVREMD